MNENDFNYSDVDNVDLLKLKYGFAIKQHTIDESNCKAGELDFETYMWMDDGKSLIEDYDRYEGICINHKWYPRGDMSLSDYLNLIRIPLEDEIVEQNLTDITEETPESEVTQ